MCEKSGQLEEEQEEITPACSTCTYSTVQSRERERESLSKENKRDRQTDRQTDRDRDTERERESLGLLNNRRKRKEKTTKKGVGWVGVRAD